MDNLDFAVFTNAIGKFFVQVLESMTDYLENNYDSVSSDPNQYKTFCDQREAINDLANELFELSDQSAFAAAKELYISVKQATDNMNDDIKQIAKVDKWINFSAGIISLGLAITSKNNPGIVSSLQSIRDAITSKPPKDAQAS